MTGGVMWRHYNQTKRLINSFYSALIHRADILDRKLRVTEVSDQNL